MSGIKRQILAEILADGDSSEMEIKKMLSPKSMRAEKGRTIYSPASKNSDQGVYIGKNAKLN